MVEIREREQVLVERLMHPGHDLDVRDPAYVRLEVAAPDESVVQPGVPADCRCGDEAAGCRDARRLPQGRHTVPTLRQVIKRPEQQRRLIGGVQLVEPASVAENGVHSGDPSGMIQAQRHRIDEAYLIPVGSKPAGVHAGNRRRHRAPAPATAAAGHPASAETPAGSDRQSTGRPLRTGRSTR
jgi:hypothetical protein